MKTSTSPSYQPDWDSLKTHPTPKWYLDGKFGIFIHWGVYSVPAFGNEWYPRNMYLQGTPEFEHHIATYGPQDRFGYKDFIPQFQAEKFDADAWADLFRRAGARFVVPVAEHHDGFPMYDSAISPWNAAKMGPKRDILRALGDSVRREGMVLGVSSHRAEHWWFMNGGRAFPSDVSDPAYAGFYGPATPITTQEWDSHDWQPRPDSAYLEDWLNRCCELVDQYRPQLFWFDWWIQQEVFQPYLQQFAAYYYNRAAEWGQEVAINYKYDSFAEGSAVLDIERGQLKEIRPYFWQNDTSISKNSWGYVEKQDYKTATDLITDLVDIVSKNGALLLNIGPRADGMIPEPEQSILLEIGRWLDLNCDSIYNTRPWRIYGEGPTEVPEGAFTDTQRQPYTSADIRFTTSGHALYATALAWPQEGELAIHALRTGSPHCTRQVHQVSLLGHPAPLQWHRDEEALKVQVPPNKPCEHAYVFKIELV